MGNKRRRDTDRRTGRERRNLAERRDHLAQTVTRYRYPSWPEQVIQYLTRYLFVLLGLMFFNFSQGISPLWWSTDTLNVAFGLYICLNTAFFYHASRQHICPTRYRLAMWVDIVITTVSLLNDPYDIPPSLLVFIMVVLGNGMRYGMRLFGEAMIGCFAAIMLAFTLRYMVTSNGITPGMLFLNLFGGIILIYAYILMGRIEQSRHQLERKTRLDTLTGLINRRGLMEIATDIFERINLENHRLVVMFADLDKFKQVNDTHGHAMGDEVLQRFAGILKESIRSSDVAARLGGDEFVILLCDAGLDDALEAAERIQQNVNVCAETHGIDCSVSIGIGEAPTHGKTLDDILARVDEAMYQLKISNNRGSIQCAVPQAS